METRWSGRSVTFRLMNVDSGRFEGKEVRVVLPLANSDTTNTILLRDVHGKWHVARRGSSHPTTLQPGHVSKRQFKEFAIRNL